MYLIIAVILNLSVGGMAIAVLTADHNGKRYKDLSIASLVLSVASIVLGLGLAVLAVNGLIYEKWKQCKQIKKARKELISLDQTIWGRCLTAFDHKAIKKIVDKYNLYNYFEIKNLPAEENVSVTNV